MPQPIHDDALPVPYRQRDFTDGCQSARQPLRRGRPKRIDVSFVLLLGLVSLA
jgi:hypothetical protein